MNNKVTQFRASPHPCHQKVLIIVKYLREIVFATSRARCGTSSKIRWQVQYYVSEAVLLEFPNCKTREISKHFSLKSVFLKVRFGNSKWIRCSSIPTNVWTGDAMHGATLKWIIYRFIQHSCYLKCGHMRHDFHGMSCTISKAHNVGYGQILDVLSTINSKCG